MAAKVKIATMYDYDSQEKPGVDFDPADPNSRSVTNQSDRDAADINSIMARYEKTGMIPDALTGALRTPMYGDFTLLPDFHTAQVNIARTKEAFAALPAGVRARFENDPAKLIDFLADSKNDVEAVKLGLKPEDVLLTALADDGVTKILPQERANLDAAKAAKPPAPAEPAPGQPA